ncbi:MAG: sigma-54-dependent Fis family transcriptional regulator, partial [Gemmatimonadetes bacterium]|nr:sigma-54-dependent Fis family transcriptional regulator [Gemmatimonadota bacterium]
MKKAGTVLLVDDEDYVRDSLAKLLERRGWIVRVASSAKDATQAHLLDGVDVVISDLRMPDEDGLTLVGRLAKTDPALPVIVLTGHGTVKSAVDCMKAGAFEYVMKPVEPDELGIILERATAQSDLKREVDYLRDRKASQEKHDEPLGVSAEWKQVVSIAELAAPTDTSV